VERVNLNEVKPLVGDLVKTPFFRYFKVRQERTPQGWGRVGGQGGEGLVVVVGLWG
jgi:hypothetical protein